MPAPKTIYVDASAPLRGDGTKANPFQKIWQGLGAAEPHSSGTARPGDTVMVAPGIYAEHHLWKDGAHLVLQPGVEIESTPDAGRGIIDSGSSTDRFWVSGLAGIEESAPRIATASYGSGQVAVKVNSGANLYLSNCKAREIDIAGEAFVRRCDLGNGTGPAGVTVTGTAFIEECDLRASGANYAVKVTGGYAVIRSCNVRGEPTAELVDISGASDVQLLGSRFANDTAADDVTCATGGTISYGGCVAFGNAGVVAVTGAGTINAL